MSSDKPLPFIYQFAAGAVAGVSEVSLHTDVNPHFSEQKKGVEILTGTGTHSMWSKPEYSYRPRRRLEMMHTTAWWIASERLSRMKGTFSRLYRGISAPILMEAPKRATKFAANDAWGRFYRDLFGVQKMNQSLSVLTGATAGATESFVVVPFELVKIRLQDRTSAGRYSGMIDCVAKIVKQEGPLALYNGLESTLWRHILWNAGYFGCIFQVRALLPKADNKSTQMGYDLLSGATGGTVGTILNTPMDVVKSRIQNSPKVAGTVPKYNWAWPALGTVMKEEGFGALYKGFIPKVLRLGPGGGILLVVFTGVMDFFRKMREEA
ncbi:Mitochondrial 2-oxodicarboxylate carrier [Lachnellula subtilissima]|uniref:Mitochondrial 2-oxodicarboxylate carrier n=1 Tax=Lachnellula subtilissima TaxID=602034 RepID=A0A8H8U916_9HELO|nr:Mitochondrial 2-oxodicarboxylate carrier [Lachnellula subtilissima]